MIFFVCQSFVTEGVVFSENVVLSNEEAREGEREVDEEVVLIQGQN